MNKIKTIVCPKCGENTYNTIQVITSDQYDSIQRQDELNKKIQFGDAES